MSDFFNVPYYWRLSAFYFCYFAALGALMPYWTLYLDARGFDAQAIGELMAIIMVSRLLAPMIWANMMECSGRHILFVRLNSFLALLFFLGTLIGHSYGWLALVMSCFNFFWSAALPQFEANTLAHLGAQAHRYTHIRLWGSIGFISTVTLFGWLFQLVSVLFLPSLMVILFVSMAISSLLVPEASTPEKTTQITPFWQTFKNPSVIALFIVCFLMQASHGPYYTFYSIYLEGQGYSRTFIGSFWALGVIAEVGVFLILHRLFLHFSLQHLLLLSFVLSSFRWLLIGYGVEWTSLLVLAQLLHAASFGMYHGVAMQFIRHYFMHHQGRAQALYSSLSFGAGSAVGSLLSGYTWDNLGADFTFGWAALCCALGILISWKGIKHENLRLE